MAIKHVKKYFKQTEQLYLELAENLEEMREEFAKGECTEEELNNLLIPVNNLKTNYQMLSYILFLLYQPAKEKKKANYLSQNKELYSFYKDKGLLSEDQILEMSNGLEVFKKNLKEKFKHE
jgi:hypothetical protein